MTDSIIRLRAATDGSRFIAADGGMRHAVALNATPELWVGDFDSTPADLRDAFPNVPKQPYPAAKAATDGEIAISEAIDRGVRSQVSEQERWLRFIAWRLVTRCSV